VLVTVSATPASSEGVKYEVYQKTLATFSAQATGLSPQQKLQVIAAVRDNPNAEKFICTGIRYFSQPMSVNIMVRKRAKAACEYAKELNPNLSTWFQNKPTRARSYAGKVLLTIKSPESAEEVEVSRGIVDQPDTVVGFQIKPIYLKPSDAPDTEVDINGTIAATLLEGQALLSERLGLTFEIDRREDGQFDIGYIDSPLSISEIGKLYEDELDRLLLGTEFQAATENRKTHLIFIGGYDSDDSCGRAETPGRVATVLMDASCSGPAFGLASSMTRTWVHEVFHNLGVSHVPNAADSCELMSGEPCRTTDELSIDENSKYYVGSSAAGADVTSLKVWKDNNSLLPSDEAKCEVAFIATDAERIDCTIGVAQIATPTYCYSGLSSYTLQEFKDGIWTAVGTGSGMVDSWVGATCSDPSYKKPTVTLDVATAGEREFRWLLNGQPRETFKVTFQYGDMTQRRSEVAAAQKVDSLIRSSASSVQTALASPGTGLKLDPSLFSRKPSVHSPSHCCCGCSSQ